MAAEWHAESHEEPDVRTRRILWLVFGFLGCVAILFGGLGVYYRGILQNHIVEVSLRTFPAPELQPNPTQDEVTVRAAQLRQLTLSGPSPADPASVRVPIDQAMAIVVARGAQAYDPVAGTLSADPTLVTGTAVDGAPRASPAPLAAPYGARR